MERLRNKLIAHPSMSWLKLNPLITWPDCLVSSKGHLCVNQFKLVDFSLIWRSLRRFHFGWLDDQPRSGGSFNHRISFNYLLSLTEIVFRRKEDKKKRRKRSLCYSSFYLRDVRESALKAAAPLTQRNVSAKSVPTLHSSRLEPLKHFNSNNPRQQQPLKKNQGEPGVCACVCVYVCVCVCGLLLSFLLSLGNCEYHQL